MDGSISWTRGRLSPRKCNLSLYNDLLQFGLSETITNPHVSVERMSCSVVCVRDIYRCYGLVVGDCIYAFSTDDH